jgi:hypothetical protein
MSEQHDPKSEAHLYRWLIILSGIVTTVVSVLRCSGLDQYATQKSLGQPCQGGADCRSRRCLKSTHGMGICSRSCASDSDCPGMRCFQTDCAPRPSARLGDPCSRPWECPSSLCLQRVQANNKYESFGDGFCSQRCGQQTPCPAGFDCVDLGAGGTACFAGAQRSEQQAKERLQNGILAARQLERASGRPLCSMSREWIEFEGLRNPLVGEKINGEIRRKAMVGQRLTQEQCPDDDEQYLYKRKVDVSGEWGTLVGIQTSEQLLGGNKWRLITRCEAVDLETSEAFSMKDFLAPRAAKEIQQRLVKADNAANRQGATWRDAAFCLTSTGLQVRLDPDRENGRSVEVTLGRRDLERLFRLPAPLLSRAPRQ